MLKPDFTPTTSAAKSGPASTSAAGCLHQCCINRGWSPHHALIKSQIRDAAEASIAAGVDFIKSSTGFYSGTNQRASVGASDDMVAFMIECAAGRCQVKASGAIRDRAHLLRLIDAGIDRMGIGHRSTPVVLGLTTEAAATPGPGY